MLEVLGINTRLITTTFMVGALLEEGGSVRFGERPDKASVAITI